MEILFAVNEGTSEHIVGCTFALQSNHQFWFRCFWRPELGGNADPDVQGNLGNAPDTAQTGQNGELLEESPLHSW